MPTAASLLTLVRGFFPDRAHSIGEHLSKELGLYTLNGGQALYLVASDLDLDSDGSGLAGDATSQSETSLRDTDGNSLDSNAVPFFVLPGRWKHGAKLGDYGVIFTSDHYSFFICGDIGPATKISEGSLEMHRRLGAERVRNGRVIDTSLDKMVRVLIFPGSGSGIFTSVEDIEDNGNALVEALTEAL